MSKSVIRDAVFAALNRIYSEKGQFLSYGFWTLDEKGKVDSAKFILFMRSENGGRDVRHTTINRYRQKFEQLKKLGETHGDANIKVA